MNSTSLFTSRRGTLLFLIALTALLTWLAWNTNAPRMGHVLTNASDPLGYYQWLPGTFLAGDWDSLPYVAPHPSGKGLSLFTMGVALLQAPFFIAALVYCELTSIEATGYELPFVFTRLLASAFYCSLGLTFLVRVLRRYWTMDLVMIGCALLLFGTNLYYYAVHDGGMSHVYSFCLFAWLLFLTLRFIEQPTGPDLLALFICGTLIMLIRPLNGVVLLLPLLYGAPLIPALQQRWKWVKEFHRWVILGLCSMILIILPQLLYWKSRTGSYVVFTYGVKNEGFDWGAPHLWDILFSHQGGWLLYTPLMIGAMVVVVRGAWTKLPAFADWRTVLLIWCAVWYLYSSWWNWWLGGSFGHRGFVEYYGLLALPFATYIVELIRWAGRRKWALLIPATLLVFLNVRMSHLAFSPMDGPTWTWDSLFKMWGEAFFV